METLSELTRYADGSGTATPAARVLRALNVRALRGIRQESNYAAKPDIGAAMGTTGITDGPRTRKSLEM